MIVTMELPDDFHILNIGLIDANDKHSITRSFTKCELIEKDEYIEKSEFTSFPADKIDDTIPNKESNHEFSDAIAEAALDILGIDLKKGVQK